MGGQSCGRKSASLLLLCWLALPLSGQSFDPAATYPVKGSELIQLEQDLLTAQAELKTLRTQNAQLLTDSESKQTDLLELQTQLRTVSQSWTASINEALSREIWVASGGVVVGVLVTLALSALQH